MEPLTSSANSLNANSELKEFITKSKARLQAILEQLQWTEESVLRDFNSNSKATQQVVENPDEIVGSVAEPELPASCATKNSVIIAASELRALVNDNDVEIPQKFSDIQVNFTREQKLRIYEHVVEHTGSCTEPEVQIPPLNEGQLSFAEIVAEKKREKKNKRRHRTSKPTHIEEVRGLVELQMQALQQYLEVRAREEHGHKRENMNERNRLSRAGESSRYQSNTTRSHSKSGNIEHSRVREEHQQNWKNMNERNRQCRAGESSRYESNTRRSRSKSGNKEQARTKKEHQHNPENMNARNRHSRACESSRYESKTRRSRSKSGNREQIRCRKTRSRSRHKSKTNKPRKYARSRSSSNEDHKKYRNISNRSHSRPDKEQRMHERARNSSRSRKHLDYENHRNRSKSRSKRDNEYKKRNRSRSRRREIQQRSGYDNHSRQEK